MLRFPFVYYMNKKINRIILLMTSNRSIWLRSQKEVHFLKCFSSSSIYRVYIIPLNKIKYLLFPWMVLFQTLKDFIYFLEMGREGGREGEKHQCVVASCVPLHWGPGPQPRPVPWLGIKLATLWFTDWHSTTEPHQPGMFFQTFKKAHFYLTSWNLPSVVTTLMFRKVNLGVRVE